MLGKSVNCCIDPAGRAKTITGFQTHLFPVLLGVKDRAEFANKEYSALTSVLEGVVIVEPVVLLAEATTA